MRRLPIRPVVDLLRSPRWVAVALVTAVAMVLFVVWLPNLGLVIDVVLAGDVPVAGKLRFLWSSLGAIGTNFTTAQASLLVLIAVLFGLNAAVALHTVRQHLRRRSGAGLGLAGIIAGLVGAGCSACGAVVLAALLGAGTTAAVIRVLPLHGLEFSLAAVLLLTGALLVTARQAQRSQACDLPPSPRPDSDGTGTEPLHLPPWPDGKR